MNNIMFFFIKEGRYDMMLHNMHESIDYLTRDEMFADLEIALALEGKVIKKLFSVSVPFGAAEKTPIGKDFEMLHRYIFKRVWEIQNPSERLYLIHRVLGFIERVETADKMEMAGGFKVQEMRAVERLKLLVHTADAYRCLDDDEAITLRHAMLLTGMSEASIRNAASRGEITLVYHDAYPGETFIEDGVMSMGDWITSRAGYRHPPTVNPATGGETVRVPFAADGSYFSPDCRMRKGYQVGKRGGKGIMAQRYISDYWQALAVLERMAEADKPYWRRPSATTGVPGTVVGRSWGRVEKKIIEQKLDEL